MNKWKLFSEKHPKAAKWIYQIFYFWVFSMGVTVFQYLMFTILPYAFGQKLAGTEFMWPQVPMKMFGIQYTWNILGYNIIRNETGKIVIGGGLGYFFSYELGTFLAQCINFPLQRNITFKSKGNVYRQIGWYVVAWLLISVVCNAINGFWMPVAQCFFAPIVYNLLVTFITGGVSMVIYFFVFKIIFPEGEKK
jgi:putative flippase GtrA